MANKYLSTHIVNHAHSRATRKRVIIIEEPVLLPEFMKHLSLFCTQHALPLPLRFLAESASDRGKLMAVYGCSDRRCSYQEGWIHDPVSGHPRRLWGAFYEGRR
jgi:hypothetical protein